MLLPASLRALAALATLGPGREGGLLGLPGLVVSRGCFCGVAARFVAGSHCIRIPGTRAGRGDGAHVAAAACPHMLSAMWAVPRRELQVSCLLPCVDSVVASALRFLCSGGNRRNAAVGRNWQTLVLRTGCSPSFCGGTAASFSVCVPGLGLAAPMSCRALVLCLLCASHCSCLSMLKACGGVCRQRLAHAPSVHPVTDGARQTKQF